MTCDDWRTCTDDEAATLLATEAHMWLNDLRWDVSAAWLAVEAARQSQQLPGFVVRDSSGQPAGWTAFAIHQHSVQVFALVARDAHVTNRLIEAVLDSVEAERADTLVFCVRAGAPGLETSLAECGFLVERYRYLSKTLVGADSIPTGLAPWIDHTHAMTDLCARAYAACDCVRPFALDGSMTAWDEYVRGLVTGPGCGTFAKDLSFVVPGDAGCDLDAGIVVTDLGPSTIHVAQLAVAPGARRRHLGSQLMRAVETAGFRRGAKALTLLVASSNQAATTLYERRGFQDRSAFVIATRRQPSLSTSFALVTGGDSTRL